MSRTQTPRTITWSSAVLVSVLAATGMSVPAHAADLTPVPKGEYRLTAVSSESDGWPTAEDVDGTALAAFDGDFATQWTSRYASQAPFPHWIVLDLQRALSVAAIDYSVKQGQQVAAQDVAVYVTDDAAVAKTAPGDGSGWGAPAATATLHAPTANDERQRVTLNAPVSGQYVAFEILTAVGTTGGGAGELEVFSDAAELPPVPEAPTDPETPDADTVALTAGGTTANVSTSFPQIVNYEVAGATLGGQSGTVSGGWVVNGTERTATTTSTVTDTAVTYVSELDGIAATITSTITVTDDGVVEFAVTDVAGADAASVSTLALPNNAFLSATAADGAVLDRTTVSPDSTKNADEHLTLAADTAVGQKSAAYAFLGNGSLIGSVITNSTVQRSASPASWDQRLITKVTDAAGRTASISSSAWLVHPAGATDERVTTFEMPRATVLLTADRNGDGAVDWQDGGIRYREVDTPRLGADRVADRVVNRIPFNFASGATNYFDLVLENTKRVANETDGLGQWVLNKGYGSEGHDSANTDYGGNYNERAGGLADFNHLVDEAQALNADMTVHVNATEIYPQSNAFDEAILSGSAPFSPGWSWLDQSFYIDQQKDTGTGAVLDRFQQLADEVPNLNGVYIDVYYSNGWTAEELADELHAMGLETSTEWSDKFVDNAVWAHWPNDLGYGGVTNKGINSTMVRFIQNGQADIWNNDALLGQQRLVDAEGWVGNRNWTGFVDNIWQQSLPTKFVQQFDLLTYQAGAAASLTDDVAIRMDGDIRVITMGGAEVLRGDSYLLPWQSLDSNADAGSPVNADKMYFYSASGGEKTFGLTGAFSGNDTFTVYTLGDQGRTEVGTVTAQNGTLTLTGDAGVAYVVVPVGGAERAAASFGTGGLIDPGFNAGTLDGWNPTGDVTITQTNDGAAKNQSRGDNIAQFGAAESSISQTVTGLAPGEKYSFSAQVRIAPDALRDVTMAVDAAGTITDHTWNLSPTTNYMASDSKAGSTFQRATVSFTAPESGEVAVSISAAAGAAVVSIDNARVMSDTTAAPGDGILYANDFEGNQPGWGPFVKGNAGGITDARTSISHLQDPYTTREWRNTARPFNDGALAGLAVDTTIAGDSSLMSHSENGGLVYRTDPTQLSLTPGHTYEIAFDYQAGQVGAYRWLTGTDTIVDGALVTKTSSAVDIAQALETTRFSHELSVGCGDYGWVGLERISGPGVDLALDNFTVTDLGETPGGAACGTIAGGAATLNPGSDAVFTTTFTNSEALDVSNIGVQVTAPEGYTVRVAEGSSNLFETVAAGDSVTTDWVISAPADAGGARVALQVASTYLADCDVRTVEATVNATVSNRTRIPNGQITVTASSEELDAGAAEGPASLMLDGDPGTIWHSRWSSDATDYPYELVFDLGAQTAVDGIGYLRRAANTNGPIKGYTVAVSTDGVTYTEVAAGDWQNIADWQDVDFAEVSTRYVKVTALSSISGNQFAAVAEMAIYGPGGSLAGTAPLERPADDLSGCGPVATDPTIALSATKVGAGKTVTVTLDGFAADAALTIALATGQELGEVTTDAAGAATVTVTVPKTQKPTKTSLVVLDADGNELAAAALQVTGAKGKPAKNTGDTDAH